MIRVPHTYAEWAEVLKAYKDKTNDQDVLKAMQKGTLEWQSGVAERFTEKYLNATNNRLNMAADKFQRDYSRGAVLHYGQAKLDKMQEVLYTFQKNKADVALLWLPDSKAGQILQNTAPELWEQYQNLIQEYCNGGWGIYADCSEAEQAVQICDACYGDGGSIVNRCRNMGKVARTEERL